MKEKKKGPIQKIKDWWNGLTFNQQLWITIGVWTLDGALYGSMITSAVKDKQAQKIAKQAAAGGYLQGQMDAYREMARTPQMKYIKKN